VHQIHETSLSLRAHSAPSPSKWRGQDLNTPSFPIMTTYRYISYYDLCFPSFRCHSMEHSEHGLTQHSLLKATQLPGMLFLSERGVKKSGPFQNVSDVSALFIHTYNTSACHCMSLSLTYQAVLLWHSVAFGRMSEEVCPVPPAACVPSRQGAAPETAFAGPTGSDRVRPGPTRSLSLSPWRLGLPGFPQLELQSAQPRFQRPGDTANTEPGKIRQNMQILKFKMNKMNQIT
jgi:hypothetical protein